MKVLGMNTQHDGGCCLLVDGEVACAISEERLTRKKGARGWWCALKYCLETASVSLSDVDLVVFSSYGDPLPPRFDGGLAGFGLDPRRCMSIDHHLSHAASAFLVSPFREALIVVLDGTGNNGDTESYYVGNGTEIERIGGNQIRANHRGIGKTFEAFTSFLGWTMMESGKTMALAAYGCMERFRALELFEVHEVQVNSRLKEKYVQGVVRFSEEEKVDFGEPFTRGRTEMSSDVALFVQDRTERALIELVRNLARKTGLRRLCLAGGVALNCVANQKLLDQAGLEEIFVVPAASDKGECLGNALYGHSVVRKGGRPNPLKRDSLGRLYTNEEILQVLQHRQELGNNFIVQAPPVEYARVDQMQVEVARLIDEGKVVGWMRGGSELGPRALGHRSILGDPRRRDIQHHLNEEVKHREPFCPYAPAVLEEFATRYFELRCPSPFMLLAPRTRKDTRSTMPGVVHADDTSRPQTVSREFEPCFWTLISEFYRRTGVPAVLNTSFNLSGEPIVESPADALSAFLRSGMDYLAIEDYLIWKLRPRWSAGTRLPRVQGSDENSCRLMA